MRCREARKYLSAFVDNELDIRTNIEMVEHLEMCASCAARIERLVLLNEAVESYVLSVHAPEGFGIRAFDRVYGRRQGGGGRFGNGLRRLAHNGWFRVALAAASIVVVFGAVSFFLVAPGAAYNNAAVRSHMGLMHDRIPAFYSTKNADKARQMALFKMKTKPSLPILDDGEFLLVGAGPQEVELKNVGHFAFLYEAWTVSMFVFEGLDFDEVRGRARPTHLGPTKIEKRGDLNLVAWRHLDFTYILVSSMPADALIAGIGRRSAAL